MTLILFKVTGIWLLIVLAAIANGVFREKVIVPAIGADLALPLSGILLAILVFLITYMCIGFIGASAQNTYVLVGLFWLLLTLSFEFLFGHYVAGKPWKEIIQVFDIRKGNLFVVVVMLTAISPWLTARMKGFF